MHNKPGVGAVQIDSARPVQMLDVVVDLGLVEFTRYESSAKSGGGCFAEETGTMDQIEFLSMMFIGA